MVEGIEGQILSVMRISPEKGYTILDIQRMIRDEYGTECDIDRIRRRLESLRKFDYVSRHDIAVGPRSNPRNIYTLVEGASQ